MKGYQLFRGMVRRRKAAPFNSNVRGRKKMSAIPTVRVKSDNPSHHEGFFVRNADDLRYGEVLFKADEFEALGEHEIRLKLESSSPDEYFVAEAELWLELKSKEREESEVSARSAREAETLSIAKEANEIASDALAIASRSSVIDRRIAVAAVIIAIIAATPEIWSVIKSIASLLKPP